MPSCRPLWLLFLLAALVPRADAGVIRGRVPMQPEAHAAGHEAHAAGASPGSPVVYLESAPQPALLPPAPQRAVLDQRNESFVPHVVAITVGSTVDFPNSDRTYHNVFSLSRAKRFDLGRYPRGRSRSVRFEQPGVVRVFCEIHSHMNAWILVFAHRYFAVADAAGRYHIDAVPPGSYTLALWEEGEVRARREVRVGVGDLEVDFADGSRP